MKQVPFRAIDRAVISIERSFGRLIEIRVRSRRNDTASISLDHRDAAAREVAECVCEIGVVAFLEALPRKASVRIEGNLPEQKIPEGIRTVPVDCLSLIHI